MSRPLLSAYNRRRSFNGFDNKNPIIDHYNKVYTPAIPKRELVRLNSEKSVESTLSNNSGESFLRLYRSPSICSSTSKEHPSHRSLMQGWLYVRSGDSDVWQRRFVKLSYFKLEWRAMRRQSSPCATEYVDEESLTLAAYHRIERLSDLTFKLLPETKSIRLMADDSSSVDEWITAISRVVDLARCDDDDDDESLLARYTSSSESVYTEGNDNMFLINQMLPVDDEEEDVKNSLRRTLSEMDSTRAKMDSARDEEAVRFEAVNYLHNQIESLQHKKRGLKDTLAEIKKCICLIQRKLVQLEIQRVYNEKQRMVDERDPVKKARFMFSASYTLWDIKVEETRLLQLQAERHNAELDLAHTRKSISLLQERYEEVAEYREEQSILLNTVKSKLSDLEKRVAHYEKKLSLLHSFRNAPMARYSQRPSVDPIDEESDGIRSLISSLSADDNENLLHELIVDQLIT